MAKTKIVTANIVQQGTPTREILRETLEARMRGAYREACDCIIAGDENAEKAVCKYEAYARWYHLNGFDLELFESRLGAAS